MKDKKSRLTKFNERVEQLRVQYESDKDGLISTIKQLKAASMSNEPKQNQVTNKFELNSTNSFFNQEKLNEVINNFKDSKK